jgi:hypothetical protein
MKKRTMILLVFTVSLLILGATASAGADAARKITGGVQWWSPGFHGWINLNIHEITPDEAKGMLSLKEFDEEEEPVWRRWKGHPICVAFSETEAAASLVFQIDRISGFGPGEAGQYAKFWVLDGGSSATKDEGGLIVWPPEDDQPICDYEAPETPDYKFPFQAGNLVIH